MKIRPKGKRSEHCKRPFLPHVLIPYAGVILVDENPSIGWQALKNLSAEVTVGNNSFYKPGPLFHSVDSGTHARIPFMSGSIFHGKQVAAVFPQMPRAIDQTVKCVRDSSDLK